MREPRVALWIGLAGDPERRRTFAGLAKERFDSRYTEEACARGFARGLVEVAGAS